MYYTSFHWDTGKQIALFSIFSDSISDQRFPAEKSETYGKHSSPTQTRPWTTMSLFATLDSPRSRPPSPMLRWTRPREVMLTSWSDQGSSIVPQTCWRIVWDQRLIKILLVWSYLTITFTKYENIGILKDTDRFFRKHHLITRQFSKRNLCL